MVGTNDIESANKFYDIVLGTLNLTKAYEDTKCIGYAKDTALEEIEFYITKPANKETASFGNGTQISFYADNKIKVDKFHEVALKAGGKNEGLPGLRPQNGNVYYAYIRDLDGNKICAYTNL